MLKIPNFCSCLIQLCLKAAFASTAYQLPFLDQTTGDIIPTLLALHKSFVEIPSVTGSEQNVVTFLAHSLKQGGWTVELQPVTSETDNVFAYGGNSRRGRIFITSHIDTVPPFFPYERRGDEIFGRGSVDAKGSVAAQTAAVDELRENGTIEDGDVALLYVVGDEQRGDGMKAANNLNLSWESVIFGEQTELKVASGHKGGFSFNLTAKGKAGHLGISGAR